MFDQWGLPADDPRAIQSAADFLDLKRDEVMMVAAHLGDLRMLVERVVVDRELGVERLHLAVGGDDQRVDLAEHRVGADEGVVELPDDRGDLLLLAGILDAGEAAEDVCEDSNQRYLFDLERQSLVLSADISDNTKRYRLQHLGRLFANERLEDDERYVAVKRHAEHYQKLVSKASEMYRQGGDRLRQALKLFDKETDNVRAGRLWAENNCETNLEAAQLSINYSVDGECLFSLRWPAKDRLQSLNISLSCARRLGQRDAECNLLGSIGRVFVEAGDFLAASKQFEQQLAVAREIRNRMKEGQALNSLGDAYLRLDQPRAVELYEAALAISREISDRQNEGRALNNLGDAYRNTGEFARSAEFYKQQLAIAREIGDVRSEGNALNNLGESFNNLGEVWRAIECHEQALIIAEEIGSSLGKANVLNNLGNAYQATGAAQRAITFYEQALAISNQVGYSYGENMTLANLGEACISAGHYERAIECLDKALSFFEQNGSRRGRGNVLTYLGKAHYELGEYQRALELSEKALLIAREIGSKHGEAHVLGHIGECYAALGERSRAIEIYEQVLNSFRTIGDLRGVSYTLNSLGRAYQESGKVDHAIEFYKEASKIARDTSDQSTEAAALFDLASALDQLGNRDEALSQGKLALKLYEELEHHRALSVREQLVQWGSF